MPKAMDLVSGMETFSPSPIQFGPGDSREFYVERDDEPLADLRTQLLAKKSSEKILLAGHRGSGKSTELNRLAADPEIQKRFRIVKFSAKDHLNLADFSYLDLLFILVSVTFEELTQGDEALEVSDYALEKLAKWRSTFEEVVATQGESGEANAATGAKIGFLRAFFADFNLRLRLEDSTRKTTREVIEKRLSDFLQTLETFFLDLDTVLSSRNQQLLVIIEDLDKIPDVDIAIDLFQKKGLYLTRPPCWIIYTVPISLYYFREINAISGIFGPGVMLPNIPLRTFEDREKTYSRGHELMHSFILQRLDESLIKKDALEEAIQASGGIFQQAQRLMERACLRGVSRKLQVLGVEEIRSAASDLRNDLERTLASADYPILIEVARTLHAPSDDTVRDLLHSLHLVEYKNQQRWCDINPLLEPVLKQWKEHHPIATGKDGDVA